MAVSLYVSASPLFILHLECKYVVLLDEFAKDEAGTLISEGEEDRDFVPGTLENSLAQRPAEDHQS